MVFLRVTLTVAGLLAALTSFPTAAPKFSNWSAPANLGPVVNSSSTDSAPAVSKDGRSLYFASNRLPGSVGLDIWVSQWDDATGAWGAPTNLGAVVNSGGVDTAPSLSRDGHWLFFHSNRMPGGRGGFDIWVSYREHTHDDFGWQTPVNAGSDVNSASDETDPDYLENENGGGPQLFYASNRPGLGGFDLYVSTLRPDGRFGPGSHIAELSSPLPDPGVTVRFDGLEAFFYSRRDGGISGSIDMWTATRETVFDAWSAPVHLAPPLNTSSIDQAPHIAPDRETLFFGSDRPDGFGGLDLYVSTRNKGPKF